MNVPSFALLEVVFIAGLVAVAFGVGGRVGAAAWRKRLARAEARCLEVQRNFDSRRQSSDGLARRHRIAEEGLVRSTTLWTLLMFEALIFIPLGGAALPWLRFDWDGDGTHAEDPFARATFGIYAGSDRVIYFREPWN